MGKRTIGFSSLIVLFSMRLTLLTTMVFLGWEIGVLRSSFEQIALGAQDVPEEMLQTQIATEANSPLTGLVQSANNHAQEQKRLQVKAVEVSPRLSPSIYRSVELLRLRKLLKSLLPFL